MCHQRCCALDGCVHIEDGLLCCAHDGCARREDGVVLYVVDLDSGKSVTVPRSALNMTEDQAEVLKDCVKESTACASTTTPKHSRATNAINMDNIVYRKRNRKSNDQDLLSVNAAEPVTPRSDV